MQTEISQICKDTVGDTTGQSAVSIGQRQVKGQGESTGRCWFWDFVTIPKREFFINLTGYKLEQLPYVITSYNKMNH